MPNYKGHLVGGAAAYTLLFLLLLRNSITPSFITAGEWLICALAGALFPDIDIKSRGQKYFYRIVLLLFSILIIQKQFELLAFGSIIATIPMLVRHRGIFHRLWFVVLMPMLIWALVALSTPELSTTVWYDVLFFIVGAISHLWLDLGIHRMIRWK